MNPKPMQVHRCQFTELHNGSILALALDSKNKKLACGREDGSIEIYNIKNEISLEKRIPGQRGHTISSLHWYESRLIGTTLTGLIVEWNLELLKVDRFIYSEGGAVWCAKLNKNKMALGCEDGSIKLINLEDGNLEIVKGFPLRLRRVLSLDWTKDGLHLVCGNDNNSIEKVDVKNGNVILSMKVETERKFKEAYIWSITALSGNIVAGGDSNGNVTLFDLEFGTLLYTFRSHEVDVLTLASNKKGTEFFSAGVDSKINRYICTLKDNVPHWIVQGYRRFHDHDTKALAIFEHKGQSKLFSAGLDMRLTYINLNSFNISKFVSMNYFPFPAPINISKNGLLLAMFNDHLKIWKLGKAAKRSIDQINDGISLPLENSFEEKLTLYTESSHNTLTSALSNDGQYIAFSDVSNIRLFKLIQQENNIQLSKVESFPPKTYLKSINRLYSSAKHMCFTDDELIIVNFNAEIYKFNLNDLDNYTKLSYSGDQISKISLNQDYSLLAVLDNNNKIHVMELSNNSTICQLPEKRKDISSILMVKSELIISFNDWKIKTIDVKNQRESYEPYLFNQEYLPSRFPPSISVLNDLSTIMLYDAKNYITLNKVNFNANVKQFHFNPVSYISFLNDNEMVVVEHVYSQVFKTLPPAFKSKIYSGDAMKKKIKQQ